MSRANLLSRLDGLERRAGGAGGEAMLREGRATFERLREYITDGELAELEGIARDGQHMSGDQMARALEIFAAAEDRCQRGSMPT